MNSSFMIEGDTESLLERLEVNKVIVAQYEDVILEELFPVTKGSGTITDYNSFRLYALWRGCKIKY